MCLLDFLLQQTEHFVQMANPVYAAKNPQEFKQLSHQFDVRTHADLLAEELRSSASRWGLKHSLAFRLLTPQEKSFIGILEDEHKYCPICGNSNSQKLHLKWTDILTSNCSFDFNQTKDSELLKHPDGFFGFALARAVRAENVIIKRYSERERLPRKRDGYMLFTVFTTRRVANSP